MSDEITLPITYDDLNAWRVELYNLQVQLAPLQARAERLQRLISAANVIAAANERDAA